MAPNTQYFSQYVAKWVKDTQEKLLVKSVDEYTSPITKIFKSGSEFIVVTENSIYLVDKDIPTKRISS